MPNLEVSPEDRDAALSKWIRHFQSPQLQQATIRHNVPERLGQIEKEVFAKTTTVQEYEQYWNSRIHKIMQRIQSMPTAAATSGMQQPAPAPSHAMRPEHVHNSHMEHGAYPHMSSGQHVAMSPYQHQYNAGHGGAAGAHGNLYSQQQQNAARYGTMGPQGHQMHGDTGYYSNMMYSNNHRSNMSDMMQAQHMQPPGAYRVNEPQYATGGYAMMRAAHAQGDSQPRHGAVPTNSQQQRMSAAGAASDSPYSQMRHPHQQQHGPGAYGVQSTDPAQHGGYHTGSPSHAGGNGMAGGGPAKRISSMMPGYTTSGAHPNMPQQHMADMNMQQQQMQHPHASHVHPSQPTMLPQGAPSPSGGGGMGVQGRASAAGNNVATRSARESFADGLPNFEPTPIDQIGLSAHDEDDFSDIADMLGVKSSPGCVEGGQQDRPQGQGTELAGDIYAANAQLTPGGHSQNPGQMVSPRQMQPWNTSMELMPQSQSSPYTTTAGMPQQQEQQHMHTQQAQGAAHGMGARSAAAQHTQVQHMRMQQQQGFAQGQQGYPQRQQGYGPGQAQQKGYAQAQQQLNDNAQMGRKRDPSGQPADQQTKMAKIQPDATQQQPKQQLQQPGAAQQDAAMPAGSQPNAMTTDSKMKVAQDAHREYRKAGEHVQTALKLLRIVNGHSQQGSLSPQAIAHLAQSKWVDAVNKAVGEYQHTERTLQRAVKVLKTHQDHATKEQAMQQLHTVATHARALQETLRQHIASAEAARTRFSGGGATQDPTTGTLLTPRSSNSAQGVTPPPFDTVSVGKRQHQGPQGRVLTPRQQASSNVSAGPVGGASGMPSGFNGDPGAAAAMNPSVPGDGGFRQGVATGTRTATPPTQVKTKLRIRARGTSAAAAQAASQANEATAVAARNDTRLAPASTRPNFQGSTSGAPSPRTTPPPNAPSPVGNNPATLPTSQPGVSAVSASLPNGDPKPMHMHMYGKGTRMQHSQHMLPGAMGMGGAYGAQQGAGYSDSAPAGSQHRGIEHSMTMMGQYGAAQYGATGHVYGAHASPAGGGGDNSAAVPPGAFRSNAAAALPQQPMGAAVGSPGGADMGSTGGTTAATAAAPYVMPSAGMTKAHCAPETDYSKSGNLMRLSMVPEGTQKAMLSTSLNPATHPVPPTSGLQSNSFDSDSTEVLSGPLRTPAPTTVSVCDLDLSVNDRYSAFNRTVDTCTPMVHLPGKAPGAESDACARPPAPPMALPLPDTEAAHRLVSACSTLAAEFHVSLRPAKCNSAYSQQETLTVSMRPLTVSSDGSNNVQVSAEDHSWCSIDVLLDEAAWDAGQQVCMIVWPQVHSASGTLQGQLQGKTEVLEMAANELRALMQGLIAETGLNPTLRSIVDAWHQAHSHMAPKLATRLQRY